MSEQLRSIFNRWQNLEEEKNRIREDAKELFAEAKGNGFEPKALRLAFRKKVAADEPETDSDRALAALVESYLAALEFDAGVKLARAPARARVEIIEKIPPSGAAPSWASPSREGDGGHRKMVIASGSRAIDSGPPYDDLELPANLRRTA